MGNTAGLSVLRPESRADDTHGRQRAEPGRRAIPSRSASITPLLGRLRADESPVLQVHLPGCDLQNVASALRQGQDQRPRWPGVVLRSCSCVQTDLPVGHGQDLGGAAFHGEPTRGPPAGRGSPGRHRRRDPGQHRRHGLGSGSSGTKRADHHGNPAGGAPPADGRRPPSGPRRQHPHGSELDRRQRLQSLFRRLRGLRLRRTSRLCWTTCWPSATTTGYPHWPRPPLPTPSSRPSTPSWTATDAPDGRSSTWCCAAAGSQPISCRRFPLFWPRARRTTWLDLPPPATSARRAQRQLTWA